MFKRGDKLVCINLGKHIVTNIIIGKVYTFEKYSLFEKSVVLSEFEECYSMNCFKYDIKYIRKQKLNKIYGYDRQ